MLRPQETVAIDGEAEPVRRAQIEGLATQADGAISYRVAGLANPSLAVEVRIVAGAERIELAYRVTNAGASPAPVAIAPCLQLPDEFFGKLRGWARAKRVFVVTEHGPRWIADTQQTIGVPRAEEPEPAAAPWAQHFAPAGTRRRPAAPPRDPALFGVARERVVLDAIGASDPRSDLAVLAIGDSRIGVTYGFSNCLQAGLGGRVQGGESVTFRERIFVSRRALDELLREVAPDAGRALRGDEAFVPPRARAKVLESFERGVPAGWSARGGSIAPAPPRHGFRAPTDGDAQLQVVLPPLVPLESPEFVIPPVRAAWLGIDVSARGLGPAPDIDFVLVGPDGERVAPGSPAHGKPRRFVLAVPDAWLGAPLTVRVGLREASVPTRLFVDSFVLHQLE